MVRILVVDDEPGLTWALRRSLGDEGYQVLVAHDGLEALFVARRQSPDVIVLDILMPKMDGLEVCRRLRRDPTLAAVPILFLTAAGDVDDRIAGLDEGGDDYLVKPFDLAELKARIRALLRRRRAIPADGAGAELQGTLAVGPFVLDRCACQVRIGENVAQLTPVEFDLLYYLMLHPGEICSGPQLLHHVWGYPSDIADTSLVRWHVKNLRAKIEPEPSNPSYIRTIPRQGYILSLASEEAKPPKTGPHSEGQEAIPQESP